ncbi:NrdR family transcriptional regulator [Salinibacillus kushneri]|uniref:NrdR family transcriptional regulator n=1 Tax=Salinibacillus kushneri TaxID=237682 RepID=UPI003CCBF003
MKCPTCKHKITKVIDSRPFGREIKRRRKCPSCSIRFNTYEYVDTESIPESAAREAK